MILEIYISLEDLMVLQNLMQIPYSAQGMEIFILQNIVLIQGIWNGLSMVEMMVPGYVTRIKLKKFMLPEHSRILLLSVLTKLWIQVILMTMQYLLPLLIPVEIGFGLRVQ